MGHIKVRNNAHADMMEYATHRQRKAFSLVSFFSFFFLHYFLFDNKGSQLSSLSFTWTAL